MGREHVGTMINKDRISPFLMSPAFLRRMLWVRHGVLLLFQLVGLCMLGIVVASLVSGDLSGHSSDEAGAASTWWEKLGPIGFVAVWNVLVFLMLRQSSGMLRRGKEAGGIPQARVDGGEGRPQ